MRLTQQGAPDTAWLEVDTTFIHPSWTRDRSHPTVPPARSPFRHAVAAHDRRTHRVRHAKSPPVRKPDKVRDVRAALRRAATELWARRREPAVVQTVRSTAAATIAYVVALQLSAEAAR